MRRAGCDVSQRPGSFKLQLSIIISLEKVNQGREDSGPDDIINGRVALTGKHFTGP